MNFIELEKLMSAKGIYSLADIARALDTTPQAVSNWKSRNQVPYHIINKINQDMIEEKIIMETDLPKPKQQLSQIKYSQFSNIYEQDSISLTDVLLTMAQQLKVIFISIFIFVFTAFTYVQFIEKPKYQSWATVLLPEKKLNSLGGLAGLASQFGVNVPMEATADLSSPSLYPELLRSRTFAKKILKKEFFLQKYGRKLTLLSILTHGDENPKFGEDTLITKATEILNKEYLEFVEDPKSPFSMIRVTADEPVFAKELAVEVLAGLESLNRFLKSETVNEKNTFIENRIASVESDLKKSELALKDFNEKNRQISSPALQLELKRLERNVEVQIGVYLTLKQQLELAKIEEVQESSVVQVLDRPSVPFKPSNKNLILSLILALISGTVIGVTLGFLRAFLDSNDLHERKKLRRIKQFFWKKLSDITKDIRIVGFICVLLIVCSPLFIFHKSAIPLYFSMYSKIDLFINLFYLLSMIVFSVTFFKMIIKKSDIN